MRVRTVLVFLVAVLAGVAWHAAGRVLAAQAARPPAPAFTVNRIPDGRPVSLSGLRGKVVLLFFFFPT